MVPRVGLEPTRCHHHRILSPARLPIPPSRQQRPSITKYFLGSIFIIEAYEEFNLIKLIDNYEAFSGLAIKISITYCFLTKPLIYRVIVCTITLT